MDSGAGETVIPPDEIKHVPIVEGEQAKCGIQYDTASGDLLPNLGEKEFIGTTDNGVTRHLTAQVADVNQGLLAVRKVMKAGHRVVFDDDYSYIEDKKTREDMPMRDDGTMLLLKLWCTKTTKVNGGRFADKASAATVDHGSFHRQE